MGKGYVNLGKIYTRGGDSGKTSLVGGSRIGKSSARVEAYGSIDEATSVIGVARSVIDNDTMSQRLKRIQRRLLVVGAHLASDEKGVLLLKDRIEKNDITKLERWIDEYSSMLLPLKEFVVPGDEEVEARLHHARNIVRKSERRIVELASSENVAKEILTYINRLSDLLFVMARVAKEEVIIGKIVRDILDEINKANSELGGREMLKLALAKKVIEAGEEKAREMGKDFVLSVVNSEGNLIIEEKMDNAIFASIDISRKKAYTSVALKMTTEEVAGLVGPNDSLYGLQNDPRYIVFGGGIPLRVGDEVVGAIGVSGGSVEEDICIANACTAKFEALYK